MTKQSKKSQRTKSRLRQKAAGSDVGEKSVICSSSYIVPGNPLAHKYGLIDDNEVYEQRNFTRADFRCLDETGRPTPLPRICSGTSLGFSPKKAKEESRSLLPEINNPYINSPWFTERDEDPFRDLENVQCIKQAKSGITFTQFLTPLPRIHSDGVVARRAQARAVSNTSYLAARHMEQKRSGAKFGERLRNTTEQNRQMREQRNMAKTQRQLEEMEGRASRFGMPVHQTDDVTERVQHVREEQKRIREHSFFRSIENFMKNKRRRK